MPALGAKVYRTDDDSRVIAAMLLDHIVQVRGLPRSRKLTAYLAVQDLRELLDESRGR